MMVQNDPPCLHCLIAHLIEDYMNRHDVTDSTRLFASLADVVGDLVANSEEMYASRDKIMASFNQRVLDRAQEFIEENRGPAWPEQQHPRGQKLH
jgi:hypothetical protein